MTDTQQTPASNPSPTASEQLLDLLKQVTGAASPRTQLPTAGTPPFHLIQTPRTGGRP